MTQDPDPPPGEVVSAAPSRPPAIDTALFRRLVALEEEIDAAERELKLKKIRAEEMNQALTEQMERAGVPEIVIGDHRGSVTSTLWARRIHDGVTTGMVVAALRASGIGHLVQPAGYHSGQLSSYLRDLERENKTIPDALSEVIEAHEVTRVAFTVARPTSRARRRMAGQPSSLIDQPAAVGGASD